MYRVMLVDDEILVREAMREHVDWEGLGFELVKDCQNGKEAMDYLEQHSVHVVMTDINMPFVDGMELSKYLYENFPDVEIIIFSGFSEFEYAKKAIQYQVSEYLLKPITASELSVVLQRIHGKLDERFRKEQKITKLQQTSREYNKNAGVIRSRALNDLVLCVRDPKESLKELTAMGIELKGEYFRLAILDFDIYSELYEPDFEKKQESALMAFAAMNIGTEILNEAGSRSLAYQNTEHRIHWIFCGDQRHRFEETTAELCEKIQEKIMQHLGMKVSVGIGVIVQSPEELYQSEKSAKRALQLRYTLGGGRVINMEHLTLNQETFLETKIQKLLDGVRRQQEQTVRTLLQAVRQELMRACVEKEQAYYLLTQLVRQLGEIREKAGIEEQVIQSEQRRIMQQISQRRTLNQAVDTVYDYAVKIMQEMSDANDSRGKRMALVALDYIEKNYHDPGMNLNEVCSYLAMSTSHFSTLFKEATGETFMEALTRIRMQKAKELLLNTKMKNYEIADRVGFSDPHYFSIAFKKMTGMSPTEYAKQKRA
ncbi:MAG: response regulator [Eubacteriales bacterium]|nr:response regulator [Eubacteriales bacterium]